MRKLYRSQRDKMLTGLCGGLAQTLGMDATLIRLITVVLTLLGFGSVLVIYIIASLIVPKEPVGTFNDYNHY